VVLYLKIRIKVRRNRKIINFLEIPSEVFNQLRVENRKLLWNSPENCMTVSGPLKAKIIIQGISDAVKYFNMTIQTGYSYLDLNKLNPKLNGLERYLVTLYVIRDYKSKENTTAYKQFEFETPPTGKFQCYIAKSILAEYFSNVETTLQCFCIIVKMLQYY
jgi:hypothetical protein